MGEALSNLYVGLCRFLRGEKWTAALFVQNYAVHRVADLLALEGAEPGVERDPYTIDRRFEARHPGAEAVLAACMPGYNRTPAAARAILPFLEQRQPVNAAMRAEIIRLCEAAEGR